MQRTAVQSFKGLALLIVFLSLPLFAASGHAQPVSQGLQWEGSYLCQQGATDLIVTVTSVQEGRIEATFGFNYKGISGSFIMSGTFDNTSGKLTFEPVKWIDRPGPDWDMVRMVGSLSADGQFYEGMIVHPGCGTFKVSSNSPPSPPSVPNTGGQRKGLPVTGGAKGTQQQ